MTTTAALAPQSAPEDPTPVILTKADRCDLACPAQAFVRATSYKTIDGRPYTLDFCAHHYAEHTVALASGGWAIHDERHLINDKPSPSANQHGN